jgi:hypothetical protein
MCLRVVCLTDLIQTSLQRHSVKRLNRQIDEQIYGVRLTAKWIGCKIAQGLLPDEVYSPGLGRGVGREKSKYSISVRNQLPHLLESINRHGKNLNCIGWSLWKSGYAIDARYWRNPLEERVQRIEKLKRFLGTEEHIPKLLRTVVSRKRIGSYLGNVKRSLRGSYGGYIEKTISIVTSSYVPIAETSHDEKEAQKDLQQFARATKLPAYKPETNIDATAFEAEFNACQGLTRLNLREWLKTISDVEILDARNEIFPFIEALIEFGRITRKLGDPLATWMLEAISKSYTDEVGILLGWLWLRQREGVQERTRELTELLLKVLASLKTQIAAHQAAGFANAIA